MDTHVPVDSFDKANELSLRIWCQLIKYVYKYAINNN